MIVLLDTNVVISAMLSPAGPAAEIISRWEAAEFDVVVSPALLAELGHALQYPKVVKYSKVAPEDGSIFLRHYADAAILVSPEIELDVIPDDPGDDRVLECAVAGGASFIISGDMHLRAIKEYQGIVVLSPAEFIVYLNAR